MPPGGLALRGALVRACVFLPAGVTARCYGPYMAYPLTAAQTHLGELVAEARHSHRPVTISETGEPVAALIDIDDLADLQDRAAPAGGRAVAGGDPRPAGAAEGGEAVSGDGSGHAGYVTDHGGGGGVLTAGASLGVPNVCRAAGLQAFEQIAS